MYSISICVFSWTRFKYSWGKDLRDINSSGLGYLSTRNSFQSHSSPLPIRIISGEGRVEGDPPDLSLWQRCGKWKTFCCHPHTSSLYRGCSVVIITRNELRCVEEYSWCSLKIAEITRWRWLKEVRLTLNPRRGRVETRTTRRRRNSKQATMKNSQESNGDWRRGKRWN